MKSSTFGNIWIKLINTNSGKCVTLKDLYNSVDKIDIDCEYACDPFKYGEIISADDFNMLKAQQYCISRKLEDKG